MKTKTPQPKPSKLAILSAEIQMSDDGWYQLLPAGYFSARDGRPFDVPGGQWFIDATIAEAFIAATAAINQPVLFDYNHVTLHQENNPAAAKEAIAAAWLREPRENMQWREGKGLYVRLSLTPAAQTAVDNKEWLYLSAVFLYSDIGHPEYLRMGALTNDPGLTGMEPMAALAAKFFDSSNSNQQVNTTMNELLRQLLAQLGIEVPEDLDSLGDDGLMDLLNQAIAAVETLSSAASAAVDAQAALDGTTEGADAVIDTLATAAPDIAEAEQLLEEAALSGVDLTKFVPAKAYQLLARRAAILSAGGINTTVNSIIEKARRDGRVFAGEVPYLRALGNQQGVVALNAAIGPRPSIAALSSQQTNGLKKPNRVAVLSASEKEAARIMGISEKDYLVRKQKGTK